MFARCEHFSSRPPKRNVPSAARETAAPAFARQKSRLSFHGRLTPRQGAQTHPMPLPPRIFPQTGEQIMSALAEKERWGAISAPNRRDGVPRRRRIAALAAQAVGWSLLVPAGLLTGFAIAASVQHVLAI